MIKSTPQCLEQLILNFVEAARNQGFELCEMDGPDSNDPVGPVPKSKKFRALLLKMIKNVRCQIKFSDKKVPQITS
jgi:hypothetical protein